MATALEVGKNGGGGSVGLNAYEGGGSEGVQNLLFRAFRVAFVFIS